MSNEETSKSPKRVRLLDEKIKDAREDVEKAQAKLDALLDEQAARDRLESIAVGTEVTFEYGRGEKRRVLTGTVVIVGTGEQAGNLGVQAGEGFDLQVYKIAASALIFDNEEGNDE